MGLPKVTLATGLYPNTCWHVVSPYKEIKISGFKTAWTDASAYHPDDPTLRTVAWAVIIWNEGWQTAATGLLDVGSTVGQGELRAIETAAAMGAQCIHTDAQAIVKAWEHSGRGVHLTPLRRHAPAVRAYDLYKIPRGTELNWVKAHTAENLDRGSVDAQEWAGNDAAVREAKAVAKKHAPSLE